MNQKIFWTILFSSLFICEITFASTPAKIQDLQKRYDTMQTLRTKFIQKAKRPNFTGSIEEVTQKGHIEIKKPGKFRWVYDKPEEKIYTSNGKQVWVYTPNQKQVIVSPWEENSLALQFLLGLGKITRDFDIRKPSAQETNENKFDDYWFHLTPKKQLQEQLQSVQAFFIHVDKKTSLIDQVWVIDPLGSKTQWAFAKMRLNSPMDNEIFEFKIPKGVQVIQY